MNLFLVVAAIFFPLIASTRLFRGTVCVSKEGKVLGMAFPYAGDTSVMISKRTAMKMIEACEKKHGNDVHQIGIFDPLSPFKKFTQHTVMYDAKNNERATLKLDSREAFQKLRDIQNDATTTWSGLPPVLAAISSITLLFVL